MDDIREISLKEFIEENQALLSALAVLATLTAFITKLSIEWLAIGLSFVFIIGMIIVWHEINSRFPIKISFKLLTFRYVLLLGFSGLILYSLLEFRQIWNAFLFIPLFMLFTSVIILALKPLMRISIIKRICGIGQQKNVLQKLIKIILLLIIMWISLILASIFSPFLNSIFTWIKISFK